MGLDVNASDLGLIDEGEPDHVVPPSALPNFGGPLSQLFFHANRPPQVRPLFRNGRVSISSPCSRKGQWDPWELHDGR